MYHLDPHSSTPLHIQLYNAIKEDIIAHYQAGDKLPSIRKLASLYNLSKNTIESSYKQLYAEGYIESFPKRGYFVSDIYFDGFRGADKVHKSPNPPKKAYRYDFFPAQLHKDDFPLKLWKRTFMKAIDESLDFGAYHDGQGEWGLREQIASYLLDARGVRCDANEIVICSGFGEAMELLAKLLKERYDTLGMESPGYHVAKRAFEAYGYAIADIAVDEKGIMIDSLKRSNAQIVYITPSHQYPTGVAMPITNRLALLEYIHSINGLIIEDDYDSELSYENRPIPSLQGLDKYDSVVYMGTFSKSLSPAIRVSYMRLPKHLLASYHDSFDAHFPKVSLTTQKTLELFMREGHYDRHVRKIRTLNRKKHNLMRDELKKHLGQSMQIRAQGGGLAILIYPRGDFDWGKFKSLAEQHALKLYFAKERSGGNFEAIRMGFGGFSHTQIVEAVEAFAMVWRKALIDA